MKTLKLMQRKKGVNRAMSTICGDNNASQIPGSELQRDSDVWMNSRWPLITASDSKAVRNMGAKLITGKGKLAQIYSCLRRKLWVNNIIATSDMLYGIREEASARLKYAEETNLDIVECGLFINKHYPYLGASPDGVVMENGVAIGIVEIKCLKVLRTRTVPQLIESVKCNEISLTNSCVSLNGDTLKLKYSHSYYYQIQHQLLVTELNFCDFVLHTPFGAPYIERIILDEDVKNDLVENIYTFWKKALIPEYFSMRIPRELEPFII